ncbi:site-specific integrase [Pseudomonas coleopterorum]|uniref:Site-specific integrase n=1 Tax=Pseudomonas coleopterorum TaxID=1605838 RepID=A0ABR9C2R7_9PSED|nr:site-specific integrase [Pseudomonas coleopterorum]MBD8755657.1 site-specific integrase [Pseudomonas coleopterorum]MBD8771637.1 site-specific integrase [Pseudomonas coleopterorum]
MFYRYLSTLDEFKNVSPGSYHLYAKNKNVMRWQSYREISRAKEEDASPTSETIFEDAKMLMNCFRWLGDAQIPTGVKVQLRSWIPPFKSARYQEYVSLKARNVIDSSAISVLDKVSRQSQIRGLITPKEIEQLAESYVDPVYPALLIFAIGTAMRPMDLCKFPYFGNGENKHIMPYSSMQFKEETVKYSITNSKGRNTRTILIHRDALKILEETYINPFYAERAKKYLDRYGKAPPLGMLFLTANGRPVTPSSISQRTTAAKKTAQIKYPEIRKNLKFYDARDWWPTQYLIRCFGEKLDQSNEGLFNYAIAQVLRSQMGHKSLTTTFQHYVDLARLIYSIYRGHSLEIFRAANLSAPDFLTAINALEPETA